MYINTPFDGLLRRNIEKALQQVEEDTQREFESVLPSLLPRLPHDAASLTRRDWELLYYVLYNRRHSTGSYKDDASVLAVLHALRQHADKIRLSYPTFWASTIAFLWASEEGEIAEVAGTCLPLLQSQLRNNGSR